LKNLGPSQKTLLPPGVPSWLRASPLMISSAKKFQLKSAQLVFTQTSDSVTRVNDSTRVTIFGDSDSTRVTLRKMLTRVESRFSQNDSTRL